MVYSTNITRNPKKISVIQEHNDDYNDNDDDEPFEPLRTQRIEFKGDEDDDYDSNLEDNFDDMNIDSTSMLDNNEEVSSIDNLPIEAKDDDPYGKTKSSFNTESIVDAVENLKTSLNKKTNPDTEDEEVDIQFMSNLMAEFKLRKQREEMND